MAKTKTTLTLDRRKLNEARALTGAPSASAVVDLALTELVRAVRLRRDVEAYASTPPSDEEIALSRAPTDWSDLADDTDWAALYVDVPEALE
ncbi:MAG TPA: type II toxin-antitoxin system VapB family antitoxin [Acidimicrobiales bacterium]|nr:type II toxin-antitoxin system VapB family antitoxin [Acidimicrobiales bacterium]